MELEGELPVLRQQCGSKANSNTTSYMCDHVGMRRVKARQRTIRLGIWKRINKFAKVILCLCAFYLFFLSSVIDSCGISTSLLLVAAILYDA